MSSVIIVLVTGDEWELRSWDTYLQNPNMIKNGNLIYPDVICLNLKRMSMPAQISRTLKLITSLINIIFLGFQFIFQRMAMLIIITS